MATEQGGDYRLMISNGETGQAEVYLPVGGENSLDWTRSSTEVDESTKDDGAYGNTNFNQQKISISANGNAKLPDDGLERAMEVAKSVPPKEKVKIMKGQIVKFHGLVAFGNEKISYPKNAPATWAYDMSNSGAPIVDDLGAAA